MSAVIKKFLSQDLLSNLLAGLTSGIIIATVCIALGSMIFSGALSPYMLPGIGFVLFGTFILSIISVFGSSLPFSVCVSQDSPAVILALIGVGIAQNMPGAAPEALFITMVAAIVLSSLLTGAAFLAVGHFRLANLVRYIPYPVVGGFLAGTGLLLAFGGISVLTGESISLAQPSVLWNVSLLARWLPGLVFAVVLLAALRRFNHFLILPGMLVASAAIFYLFLALTHTSVDQAIASGFLLDSLPATRGSLWKPVPLNLLGSIDWAVLGSQAASFLTLVALSVISALLNITGIELAVNREMDLERDLKNLGISNLALALSGGITGYYTIGITALAHRIGGKSRLVGGLVALVCLVTVLLGGTFLKLFPAFILGGFLIFLGLDFLMTWLYDTWFKLPKTDYALIWLILLVIGYVGFLQGVGTGILIAVVLFVFNYSRSKVIRHYFTGVNYQSTVERPLLEAQLLEERGEWLRIFELQGYVFFGTINSILQEVRECVVRSDRITPRFVLVDFRLVTGLDSSAELGIGKIRQFLANHQIMLVLTHLSPEYQRRLRSLLETGRDILWKRFEDLDHGVEWCEQRIIETFAEAGLASKPRSLVKLMTKSLQSEETAAALLQYFTPRTFNSGDCLIREGEKDCGLFIMDSGQVQVELALPDGRRQRLRSIGSGSMVGEISLYLRTPASASVVAVQATQVYHLSAAKLAEMQAKDATACAGFHQFMAQLMAQRTLRTTRTLEALMR